MTLQIVDDPTGIETESAAVFYDPTGSHEARAFTPAPRRRSLAGATVALLSNQKRNADRLIAEIARLLREEHGVESTFVEVKEAMSLPAPEEQLRSLARRAEALVVAVGDCGSCSATTVMDAIAAERLGVPAVAVVTDQFRPGAEMVAQIQGATGFDSAYIDHPIATLDDAQLHERARQAVESVTRILCG